MKLIRTPLRISFIGGGSDIPSHYEKYGGAVLSATINKYIYITAKEHLDLFPHNYRLAYSELEKCNGSKEIKHSIIRTLVNQYAYDSLDLDVISDVPAGTGLGSSSAFTVCLHNSLMIGNVSKHTLAELACHTELFDLKEPIGKQDHYAASFGGINLIEFTKTNTVVRPILLNPLQQQELLSSLTLIYVGGQRSASQQLTVQRLSTNSLSEMANYAKKGYKDLVRGNIESLGDLIYKGWSIKKSLSLNISTPQIDLIIDTALNNGATGGKLLGAGGGGFVLLFCPPRNKNRMFDALKPLNLKYVWFNFDYEGSKVLYEDEA